MVCTVGVVCASLPLLGNATVSVSELIILFLGMLSYSVGAIYFSSGLSLLAINGWQTLLGGLFLLPVTFFFYKNSSNHFNNKFWLSVGWLAILVSIFAAWILKDSISIYTVVGVLLVIVGLLLSRMNVNKNKVLFD